MPSVSLDSDHRLVVMQIRHTIKKLKPAKKKKIVNLHNPVNGETIRKEFEDQIAGNTGQAQPRRTKMLKNIGEV